MHPADAVAAIIVAWAALRIAQAIGAWLSPRIVDEALSAEEARPEAPWPASLEERPERDPAVAAALRLARLPGTVVMCSVNAHHIYPVRLPPVVLSRRLLTEQEDRDMRSLVRQ